jgi:ligand-binding sensor domain-containing protein
LTATTLYAGTADSGVFKSTNGGGSWTAVDSGLADTSIGALVIDPATESTVYAGTSAGDVFKSTDSGGRWKSMSAGLTTTAVTALAIDPTSPANLYAGTSGGGVLAIEQVNVTPTPTPRVSRCVGDCNDSGTVTVDELLTMVHIALGDTALGSCSLGDANGDGVITVDEILAAVVNALNGCV